MKTINSTDNPTILEKATVSIFGVCSLIKDIYILNMILMIKVII